MSGPTASASSCGLLVCGASYLDQIWDTSGVFAREVRPYAPEPLVVSSLTDPSFRDSLANNFARRDAPIA